MSDRDTFEHWAGDIFDGIELDRGEDFSLEEWEALAVVAARHRDQMRGIDPHPVVHLVRADVVQKDQQILHNGIVQKVSWITTHSDGEITIATFSGRTAMHILPDGLVAVVEVVS